ncbi:MAG: alanine--glyoxylate aminotransferase family protein [Terriglobales bacterium]
MIKKNRLFTPGPTPLLPAAQTAMAAANIHHRTADFKDLFQKTLADLKTFIGTTNDVILLASSGTGAMEASVSNLTGPGEKVLVLTAGKFGERWRDLAKAYGCAVELISAPYGQTFTLESVREKLSAGGVRVVYLQATESSTGVRHDVEGVAKLIKQFSPETMLVVDAITGLGTTRFNVDGWGIDVIIGGSQKAVMVPPGLAYCAVSERAWKRMDQPHSPSYYFDLRKERKSAAKGESAFTPAIALVAALAAAMDFIRASGGGDLAAGRDALIHNAEVSAEMTRAAAQALGLKLFATVPADALTAIIPPGEMDSGIFVKDFRERFDAVVANGQGDMKGKLFRIAHLGYYDYLDTIGIIGALEHVLAKAVRPKHIEFGAGLRAAQTVYAKQTAEAKTQSAK